MAKISISIPDELVDDLHAVAAENVSAFVSSAIRHELDRRRLFGFLDELAEELGPVDEADVAVFDDIFSSIVAAKASPRRASRARVAKPKQTRSAS